MRLVDDYRAVLKKAWSVRFMAAAFVFSALEIALPMLDGLLPIPAGAFAAMTGLCTGAAFVSRLVAQQNLGGQS
ncbi:hypothetical protein NS365_05590 [Aureimonas ureilytica]|uniref:Uncharacterized protein n=1 Tax=Aureimonas ureilytica TaxID=401562 RepID=A0A175RTR0_9HYPH|nr:hypothetical protein [Aureimonas ureilytica]KTR06907.1 hypothetical protein NS365_05590 [Aureimonas ureilytica]